MESLEARALLAANVIINEILYDPADKTEPLEFVELHNAGDETADLSGWVLENGVDFIFPADSTVEPGGFLVVSQEPNALLNRFGAASLGPFSGRLANEGDHVVLRNERGEKQDEVQYQIGFPWPTAGGAAGTSMELVHPALDNDLGGSWRSSGASEQPDVTLIAPGGQWKYFKGTSEPSTVAGQWRQLGFDDVGWLQGAASIGYGDGHVVTTLSDMRNNYSTVYLRREFQVDNPGAVQGLLLEAQFDDGINVWINGALVLSNNAPGAELPYTATASSASEDTAFRTFTLPNPGNYLVAGKNVIAVQLLNGSLGGSSDAWFDAGLINSSASSSNATPGAPNSVLHVNPAPQMRQVEHRPKSPSSSDDVTVTVKVTDPDGVANVQLQYQLVNPGDYIDLDDSRYATDWTTVPMTDDGSGGDEASGDDVYTAVLPSTLQEHRRLVRYRITAEDAAGKPVTAPYADDPQPNFAYFVYDQTPAWTGSARPSVEPDVTYGSDVLNSVPVYQLITSRAAHQDSQFIPTSSRGGGYTGDEYLWSGTMVYDGEVYDHVNYRARGGVWRYAMGKNMWKFDFLRGHEFQGRDDYGEKYDTKVDKLNFSALIQQGNFLHRGEQGLFESVGFKLFNLAGVEGPHTNYVHFRIVDDTMEGGASQFDTDFQGLYLVIEQPDGKMLDEHGLPDGNFYKMESGTGTLNNQGPTQPNNGSDLSSFISTYTNSTPNAQWWRDHLDLDRYYSYRSIVEAIHHYDIAAGKNYFYYHNPDTGKWQVHPWDLDLTWANNMYGSGDEPFNSRVARRAEFSQDYRNRLREILDLLCNPEQTGMLIDETAGMVHTPGEPSLVDADRAMWDYNPIMVSGYVNSSKSGYGRFYESAPTRDFPGMVQLLKNYVVSRTAWMESTILSDRALIPQTPSVSYTGGIGYPRNGLSFQTSPFSSNSGSFAALEWRIAEVTDVNSPDFDPAKPRHYEIEADWESGGITNFDASIAIPGDDLKAGDTYRVRVRMKDSAGRWSHWSEPVQFVLGEATGPLQDGLRVTEIMYNPPAAVAGEMDADNDEFEYLEFQNISNQTLDLHGVRLTEGVVFDFTDSNVTRLEPGERAVVVANLAAFQSRYDTSNMKIAGAFAGHLNNDSEDLLILDAGGGVVQSFDYNDSWFAITDGEGFSLAIRDANANPDSWSKSDAWRPSQLVLGNPGEVDDGIDPGAVQINEVLSHTDEVLGDWIELHNTTDRDINIGGWFLSDDAVNLALYPVPVGITIPAGGYQVFSQSADFGGSFGLSELGETLYLSSAGANGLVGGYRDVQSFGAAEREVTFGRHINSDGDVDFTAMSVATSSAANSPPRLGPVVIDEVMYHPASDLTEDEFIELRNTSSTTIDLFDPSNPQNTWAFLDGVAYSMPSGVSLQANERVLIVGVEPEIFRAAHGVDPSVRVFGPYTGNLSNAGESLELYRPGPPELDGFAPMIRVEKVEYGDQLPWPPQADGEGSSMARLAPPGYGNEPNSWRPSSNGGSPGQANQFVDGTPPTTPASTAAEIVSSTLINVTWSASSDPESDIEHYRLFRNGQFFDISSTTSYADDSVVPGPTYSYEVSAVNRDGLESARSPLVQITILGVSSVAPLSENTLLVTFSGPVTPETAEVAANFSLDGASVSSASLSNDGLTVTLTTSTLTPAQSYVLGARNLEGLAGAELPADYEVPFTFTTSLELWFSLDEGSGDLASDLSGNDRDGTRRGASWTTGQFGGGMNFDGVSAHLETTGVDLNQWLGASATLAFWINTTQVGNNTSWQAPGVTGIEQSGGGDDIFWGWLDASGYIRISAGNGASASSDNPINDGQWRHVALTRDSGSGEVRVYVDGSGNDAAFSEAGIKTNSFSSFGRVGDTGGTPVYLRGSLDDIRIYSRVLEPAEIESLVIPPELPPRIRSVAVNGSMEDPADLPSGPAPSSWQTQRHEIRSIVITFSEPVTASVDDLVLTNLGINAPADADTPIPLTDDHFELNGEKITLTFERNELANGVYQLQILSTVRDLAGDALDGNADSLPGDSFLLQGNASNPLLQFTADLNGDGGTTIFDFPSFAYWFGQSVGVAPSYVDFNQDGGVTIFDFPLFADAFGQSVVFPAPLTLDPPTTSPAASAHVPRRPDRADRRREVQEHAIPEPLALEIMDLPSIFWRSDREEAAKPRPQTEVDTLESALEEIARELCVRRSSPKGPE